MKSDEELTVLIWASKHAHKRTARGSNQIVEGLICISRATLEPHPPGKRQEMLAHALQTPGKLSECV